MYKYSILLHIKKLMGWLGGSSSKSACLPSVSSNLSATKGKKKKAYNESSQQMKHLLTLVQAKHKK
jgi:hypothetical protein